MNRFLKVYQLQRWARSESVDKARYAHLFTGAAKTLVVRRSWWKSGLETLVMGGLAAVMAYAVGYLLKGLIS